MPSGQTPALQNDLMAEGDNNKYILFNDAVTRLEDAFHKTLAVDLTSGNHTLTETELVSNGIMECSGHTVARDLVIPATVGSPPVATRRTFFVKNDGTASGTVTVKHPTGGTVAVAIGTMAQVNADGTDVILLSAVGGTIGSLSDVTETTPALGQVLLYNGAVWINHYGNYRAIVDEVGTTYTFILTDAGKLVRLNNAASIAVTIPTNASVAFDIGTTILLRQAGAGTVTVAPDGGVTMNAPDDGVFGTAGETAMLVKVATDEWDLVKDQTSSAQTINDQTGTTYTLVIGDAKSYVRLDNAAAITLTVPTNASVAFPIGTRIALGQIGAGEVTIAGGGVTFNSPNGLVFGTTGEVVIIQKVGTDEWDVIRELKPFRMTIAASDETTAVTNGVGKVTWRQVGDVFITEVRGSLNTANASGGPITVDINDDGTTILSTKLTVDDTEKTSTTAVTAAVISSATILDDSEMSIDIDSGSNDGAGLKISMIGYYI